MKILVYGVGVIGSLLVHELITAGNDVTVVARGLWKETLEKRGLCIRMHFGKKSYTDHPRVLSEYDGETYDITFSVMQNQQQDRILDTLAAVSTKSLVLVGNNLESMEMYQRIQEKTRTPKNLFFGFQTSGGLRHKGYVEAVMLGNPSLTLGHVKSELSSQERQMFRRLFAGSAMKLSFEDDMESWYRCHGAFIIPAACISYTHDCDLRTCTRQDVQDYLDAGREAYGFLTSIGTQIRPKGG